MNIKYALATVGLLLFGAATAQALPVTIDLTTADNISYTGLLTNTSGSSIDIGADSIFDTAGSASVLTDTLADDIFNGLTLPAVERILSASRSTRPSPPAMCSWPSRT
jgi:hypothetical protein